MVDSFKIRQFLNNFSITCFRFNNPLEPFSAFERFIVRVGCAQKILWSKILENAAYENSSVTCTASLDAARQDFGSIRCRRKTVKVETWCRVTQLQPPHGGICIICIMYFVWITCIVCIRCIVGIFFIAGILCLAFVSWLSYVVFIRVSVLWCDCFISYNVCKKVFLFVSDRKFGGEPLTYCAAPCNVLKKIFSEG